MSLMLALISRTAFRDGALVALCSLNDSEVLVKIYLNKEYFEIEYEI